MPEIRNVSEALQRARAQLKGRSDSAALDAQLLLAGVLSQTRTWVLAHPEAPISASAAAQFEYFLDARAGGTPLPYLLGEWEFYGRKFSVAPDVLIPRPETELLVEIALEWLSGRGLPLTVLDVGTGSGCIAITLALEAPGIQVIGLDVSKQALEIAARNGLRHLVSNVEWIESDLLRGLTGPGRCADLICANLPYIPTGTLRGLDVSAHEPALALDGGLDGLAVIYRLMEQAVEVLSPEGLMLLEIDSGQQNRAEQLAAAFFPEAEVSTAQDLAGRPRLVRIDRQPRTDPKARKTGLQR